MDEKVDAQYTESKGKLGDNPNKSGARTSLQDVPLAKPEGELGNTAKQPIPLEYRDILR